MLISLPASSSDKLGLVVDFKVVLVVDLDFCFPGTVVFELLNLL